MNVRELTPEDAITAVAWMTQRYKNPFPKDFFPSCGAAVFDDIRLLAVIPMYFDQTSPVAVAGHCMTSPDNSPRESYKAILLAMNFCQHLARRKNKKYLVTLYGKRSINRIADQLGFLDADCVQEKLIILS